MVHIFNFVGCTVCVTAIQPCHCNMKAATSAVCEDWVWLCSHKTLFMKPGLALASEPSLANPPKPVASSLAWLIQSNPGRRVWQESITAVSF